MDPVADNVEAPASTTGNISSGTASEAMIKAAMSASSAETPTEGAESVTAPAATGDTTKPATTGDDGATPGAKGPQVPTGQPATTGARGEAPENRIQAAVRNARTEVEAKYEWAKDVSPADGKLSLSLTREMSSNPARFAAKLCSELGFEMVPIGQQREQAPPTEQPKARSFPKPRLRAEDGTEAYAADQIPEILELHAASIRGEFKPLLEDRETRQRQEREQGIRTEVQETVKSALTDARKLPHFQVTAADGTKSDNPEILRNLQAIPAETRQRIGPIAAMYQAYQQFLTERVYPTQESTIEQRVRDSFSKKAAASSGNGHPTDQGGDGKKVTVRDGDVGGLARHMERLAESMG